MKLDYGTKAYFNFSTHAGFGSSLDAWLTLLWRHRQEIELPFVPKILYITFVILLNTPIMLYEKAVYGKKIWKRHLSPPVFILGHPRSGTTYLHYIMSKDEHLAFCAIYESFMPWIFLSSGKFLQKVIGKALPETRPMDNLKLGATQPKEEEFALFCMGEESMITGYVFPKKIYDYFRKYVLYKDVDRDVVVNWKCNLIYFMQKLNYKYKGKPLLMKSPFNTGRVRELLEMFPDAKFIHIYRDPYVVYSSNERLYEKTITDLSFQKANPEEIQDFIIKSYRDMYQKYLEDRKLIPQGNLVEFSYEEFIGNELTVLERAYKDLHLSNFESARSAFEAEISEYDNYQTNKYEMEDVLKEKIYSEWQFAFDAFGYKK